MKWSVVVEEDRQGSSQSQKSLAWKWPFETLGIHRQMGRDRHGQRKRRNRSVTLGNNNYCNADRSW